MRLSSFLFVAFFSFTSAFSQEISYKLRMTKPQNHYFQVEMNLVDFKQSDLVVKMPVWAPGSYLVREFSKNLNLGVVLLEIDMEYLDEIEIISEKNH